jgi:hypothetical protein
MDKNLMAKIIDKADFAWSYNSKECQHSMQWTGGYAPRFQALEDEAGFVVKLCVPHM